MNKRIIPILLFSFLLCGCSSDKVSKDNLNGTETNPTSESNILIESHEGVDDEVKAEKEESTTVVSSDKIVVEYKNSNGDSLFNEIGEISDISLKKPSFLSEREVFIGWKEDVLISEIADSKFTADELVLTAESMDISSVENVIYNNSVYVSNKGSCEFVLPVVIGGITDFAVMDLEISYDSEMLELIEVTSDDSDVMYNHIKEEDKILINFVSIENVNADVNLCNLKFKVLPNNKNVTALSYNVTDIAAWSEDESDYRQVNYSIVNSKIVMY
ncbi:MAG: hypothetical protein IKK66_08825 [Ruminococcus sp.]|nr:hypothetical protein [Ruminococcus sp.]